MRRRGVLVRLLHCPVKTLGPGRRIGVWFQGCSIGCEGCIAPENQPFDTSFEMPSEVLEERIRRFLREDSAIGGVTVSGGEPFDQPEALAVLVENCRTLGVDDILVYSGYTKERLFREHPETVRSLTALVDGPFLSGGYTEAVWKGSENQTLTVFDPKYTEKYALWSARTKGLLQTARDERGLYLIGIPRQQDVPALLVRVRSALWAGSSPSGERSR